MAVKKRKKKKNEEEKERGGVSFLKPGFRLTQFGLSI